MAKTIHSTELTRTNCNFVTRRFRTLPVFSTHTVWIQLSLRSLEHQTIAKYISNHSCALYRRDLTQCFYDFQHVKFYIASYLYKDFRYEIRAIMQQPLTMTKFLYTGQGRIQDWRTGGGTLNEWQKFGN